MDAFEMVVAAVLERNGYWTKTSLKVGLTLEEKRKIGRPSSPRWELDVVAYKGATNELLVVECKSYLDSRGVPYSAFDGSSEKDAKRYKLFTDPILREVVLDRLAVQMTDGGFCSGHRKIQLCLAAGNIYGDSTRLRDHFEANNWLLWDANWLRTQLTALATSGYDNSIAAIVSKLLLRLPPVVQIPSSKE